MVPPRRFERLTYGLGTRSYLIYLIILSYTHNIHIGYRIA